MWVLMGTNEMRSKVLMIMANGAQAAFSVAVLWSCIQCSALISVDVMQLFMDVSTAQTPLMAAFMA